MKGNMFFEKYIKAETFEWVLVALLTFVVFVVAWIFCLSNIEPRSTDMIMRYAPMADAFSEGDWYHAFHPRFCTLFPVLTGVCVKITNLSGNRACQFVALFFWAIAAIPLWILTRDFFGRVAAFIVLPLYFANIDLFFLAADGWRDDCRIFPTVLLVLGFMRVIDDDIHGSRLLGSFWIAVSIFMLITLRVDCFLIATTALFILIVTVAIKHQWWCLWLPLTGWFLATGLNSWMVWSYTRWWVPVPHLIKYVEAVL